MNRQSRHTRRRQGATMIDVITGSMIMSTLLIPSAHLINESRSNTHRLSVRQSLIEDAVQVVETTRIELSETKAFSDAYDDGIDTVNKVPTTYGTFSVARTRVEVDKSVLPAKLVTIIVDVWHDDNRDGRLDTDEASTTLRTLLAAP